MSDDDLLALAAGLAMQAGEVILRVRAGGFRVELKDDASPVTEADHAAEALILAGLRAGAPGIPIVAEEAEAAGAVNPAVGEYWLVDPLDGTREFAAGTPDFTVNIGLVRDGAAVLGAVALPAHGEVFGGVVATRAAWKQDEAGRRPIRVRGAPSEGLTVVASRHYAGDPALAALLGKLRVAAVSNIGSAVKFCRVAEGRADFYPRLGPMREWDTAAPQAVVEAAGGSVRLMDGSCLRYGKRDRVNPPFVCRGG